MLQIMKAHRDKRERGDEGFTLIELLVVVVIIGILIAIAIPLYLNYRRGANDKSAQSDVRNAISVLEVCNSDNTAYPSAGTQSGTAMTFTGCTGQTANLSAGTTAAYSFTAASGTTPAFYRFAAKNSGGTKVYCYNSSAGGAVKDVTSSTVASASDAVGSSTC